MILKRSMIILWYFRDNECGKYIEKKNRLESVNANVKKKKRTEKNKLRVYGSHSNRFSTMVTTALNAEKEETNANFTGNQGNETSPSPPNRAGSPHINRF